MRISERFSGCGPRGREHTARLTRIVRLVLLPKQPDRAVREIHGFRTNEGCRTVPGLTRDLLIPRGDLLDEELPESTAINDACKRGRANRRPAGVSECSREAVECSWTMRPSTAEAAYRCGNFGESPHTEFSRSQRRGHERIDRRLE